MPKLHIVIAVVAATAFAADVAAAPMPVGPSQQTIQLANVKMEIFTYRPGNCRDPSLLLVFHGVARNAPGYRDDVRAVADATCMLVVAPLFDKERFPSWRYHRSRP